LNESDAIFACRSATLHQMPTLAPSLNNSVLGVLICTFRLLYVSAKVSTGLNIPPVFEC